jgi:hypothetical protein
MEDFLETKVKEIAENASGSSRYDSNLGPGYP